jgi:tetratricopeptide (TPR) repeat protein
MTSAEPYLHLIQHAFADADSARVAGLLHAYERITHGTIAEQDFAAFPLAFVLGFGDRDTYERVSAAVDTVPTPILLATLRLLQNPRLQGRTEEALGVALARSDNQDPDRAFGILYGRGRLRSAFQVINDPAVSPPSRAVLSYQLYRMGANLPADVLEQVLSSGAADSTSTLLFLGAYAVDRGRWGAFAAILDRQRARARYWRAEGNAGRGRTHEIVVEALKGYALWKRGRTAEAIAVLEAAQRRLFGGEPHRGEPSWFTPNVTLRWWLGELMLEAGRLRDAERYFKAISADPFAASRLGTVYENLGDFERARASYEYALQSWQDADPELQPRIDEARRGLARLPEPLRRERT